MPPPCLIGEVAGKISGVPSSQPPAVDPHAIAAFVEIIFDCCNGQLPYRGLRDKGTGQESETHHKWIDLSRPNVVKRLCNVIEGAQGKGFASFCIGQPPRASCGITCVNFRTRGCG